MQEIRLQQPKQIWDHPFMYHILWEHVEAHEMKWNELTCYWVVIGLQGVVWVLVLRPSIAELAQKV